MVAFGFLPQNFWKWQGPTNGTLSFCECRFSGGDTIKWGGGELKPYLMQKNYLNFLGASVCAQVRVEVPSLLPRRSRPRPSHLVEFPLPNFSKFLS